MVFLDTAFFTEQKAQPSAPVSSIAWTDAAKNPTNPDSIYPPAHHDDLSAAGVSYGGYDETRANNIISELQKFEKKIDEKDGMAIPVETALPLLTKNLLDEMNRLDTQMELLNIEYYRDANNDEISNQSSEVFEQYIAISDTALQTLRNVLKGPNGEILKKELTEEEQDYLSDYEDMTKREKALYKEETDLVQKYDKLILNSENVKKDNKEFVDILKKLCKIRNEMAKIYGYDNYVDYSYKEIYTRDYTAEDAKILYEEVKKYIVPLYVKSTNNFYNSDYYQILYFDDSGSEILKNIAPYIAQIDPELKHSFNYLRRHHMYDLDSYPTKMDVGYTVDLMEYGSPFIFNAPYNEAADYSVTIHEFGHFNAAFHQSDHALLSEEGSYDIAEIQSQGLELLFLDYYDELFGNSSDVVKSETISNILTGVVTGCMYDEFQQVIFDDPDMSRDEINQLAAKLAKEYGLIEAQYSPEEDAPYNWVSVSHTYESPMYYISYATSALSALDIWAASLDDRDAAIDSYMKISAVAPDMAYKEALKECGLRNIFNKGAVKAIGNRIEKAMK